MNSGESSGAGSSTQNLHTEECDFFCAHARADDATIASSWRKNLIA